MRLDRGFLGWGTFFIALGLVPLAVQLGWIDRSVAAGLWQLWPLFLVAGGIGLLLRRTRLDWLGGLLAAALAGLLLGGILTAGVSFGATCGAGGGTVVADRSGTLPAGARADIEISCGRLTVATAPGDAWKVAWGPAGATAPSIVASGASLRVQGPEGAVSVFPWSTGSAWEATLPQSSVTQVRLQVNAASATAPLDGLALDRLTVSVNAADAKVDMGAASAATIDAEVNVGTLRLGLPPAGPTSGRIGANLSTVVLCAAPAAQVRVTVQPSLAAVDLPGLTRISENVYQSEGWAPGTGIDLRVEANLGSVRLERGGTCR